MKKEGLLNPQILSALARIGHTEYLVIADAGLPVPDGVPIIDISLIRGIPNFGNVLNAVADEMVVESFVLAKEILDRNQGACDCVKRALPNVPSVNISHEEFKKMIVGAKAVIRTGETTPYANIILVAGVNF